MYIYKTFFPSLAYRFFCSFFSAYKLEFLYTYLGKEFIFCQCAFWHWLFVFLWNAWYLYIMHLTTIRLFSCIRRKLMISIYSLYSFWMFSFSFGSKNKASCFYNCLTVFPFIKIHIEHDSLRVVGFSPYFH